MANENFNPLNDTRFTASLKENGRLFKERFSNANDVLAAFLMGHFITSSAPGQPYTAIFMRYFERRAFAHFNFIKPRPKRGYKHLQARFKEANQNPDGNKHPPPKRQELELIADEYITKLELSDKVQPTPAPHND